MAAEAVPSHSNTAPATVTVRVRSLLIGLGVLLLLGLIWWSLHWASSVQPLVAGSASSGPGSGLLLQPHTRDRFDNGPPTWKWVGGGTYSVVLDLTNTSHVPVTVTGADHTPSYWLGEFTGPTLGLPVHAYDPLKLGGFHPVTIPAGGYRSVGFTFHTNQRACRSAGDQSSASSIDSVTVHFTTLKLFHDTQTIPLGDMSFFLSSPTVAACTG